ncbi:MAG: cation-transporting P-type ATPase, partial [Erysipelotrichaceae bacterium]
MIYQENIYEVIRKLKSNPNTGLTSKQVINRQNKYGLNELEGKKKKTIIKLFVEQFNDPMVIILIIGAIISIILKEYIDASIILIVITMNAIIGVIQVYKAEKAIEALNKLTAPTAYVIRDNKLKEIKANQIVVGDIVQLSVGKYIPAD